MCDPRRPLRVGDGLRQPVSIVFANQRVPVFESSVPHSLLCVVSSIGQEYERKLQRCAKQAGLAFCDEEQLRRNGYDKTPDVKLEIPVAVDGVIVNWIESKALFGDEESHRNYSRSQYLSYWNR